MKKLSRAPALLGGVALLLSAAGCCHRPLFGNPYAQTYAPQQQMFAQPQYVQPQYVQPQYVQQPQQQQCQPCQQVCQPCY